MRWPGRRVGDGLVILLVCLGILWAAFYGSSWQPEGRIAGQFHRMLGPVAPWLVSIVLAMQVVPLLVRRRHPYAVAAVTVAALVLAAQVDRLPGIGALGPYIALHVAGRTIPDPSARLGRILASRWWRWATAAGVVTLVAWFGLLGAPWVALAVAVWWHGRASAAHLGGADAQPPAEVTVQQAVLDERARVARDLHDTVAHHVSVLAMQARLARRAVPAGSPETDHLLLAMETTGHLAMTDLRRALGVLTDSGGDGQPWPQSWLI